MSRRPLSRRTLLHQAARVAIGLPLLQAMLPGARLFAADPPAAKALIPKRLVVVYVPHGIYMPDFIPAQTGQGFALSPALQPLASLAGRFSVVGNLMMDCGVRIMHLAGELFLTNERIAEFDRFMPNRLSMDRLVVKHNAGQTLLPSLQLTRVISFVVFKERADGAQQYPELGLVGEHHNWTHDFGESVEKRPAMIKNLTTVDRFNCEQLAYFLQRLRDTPEGDGTMLDNTLVLYGSGLSLSPETDIHDPRNLPLVVAGGEAMGVRQGQHVRYDKPVNLANLHLTLLQRLGVDVQQWKDSTGVLSELVA